MDLPAIIKTLFDRAAYFAVVALLVAAGVLLVPKLGLAMPTVATEWAGVALVAAFAVLVVQGGLWLSETVKRQLAATESQKQQYAFEQQEAMTIVSSLTDPEMRILRSYLDGDVVRRFEVFELGPARQMIDKHAFRAVGMVGRGSYLCEVNPVIWKFRPSITPALDARFGPPAGIGERQI